MADREGSETPKGSAAGAPDDALALPDLDLAAALGGLDRATRDFSRRLDEAQAVAARAAAQRPAAPSSAGFAASREGTPAPPPSPPRDATLEEAKREARLYLERAKHRADSIIASMIEAVEHEAAAIRREAEEGIRARWLQVESDAQRHLEEAARVGEGMVAERQQRLAELSEQITSRAEAVAAGLDDAERIRTQFEAFVRALSLTAGRIAQESAGSEREPATEPRGLRLTTPADTLAA